MGFNACKMLDLLAAGETRGNDGFMWEVKKNKNGVHRWARDTKSTKRAEDYWYWKV